MTSDQRYEQMEAQVKILGHAMGLSTEDPAAVIPRHVIEVASTADTRTAMREFKRLGMGKIEASRAVDAVRGDTAPPPDRWYYQYWVGAVGGVVVLFCLAAISKWVF